MFGWIDTLTGAPVSNQRGRLARRARIASFATLSCVQALTGCVALPDTPDTQNLSELEAQYDEPDAELPEEVTAELLTRARPYLDIARRLDGLSLIRTAVDDTSDALDSALTLDGVTIQGVIRA